MTAKTTLLLLPGLLCDAALWRHQAEHLADVAEIRIPDLSQQDSMAGMARAALALAQDAPDGPFALAGLSMGGYVALEIMRQAPGRVSRLALFDTSARDDDEELASHRRGLIELAGKGQFKGVTQRVLKLYLHPDRLADAALAGAVMEMAERVGRDAFLRQQTAIQSRPDSRPGLAAIDCPTLVACGRQDRLTPMEWSEEIAAGIPGARLVAIEDCGHLSTMERPETATALLRYWLQL